MRISLKLLLLIVAVAAVCSVLLRDQIIAYNGRWLIPDDLRSHLDAGNLDLELDGYIKEAKLFPSDRLRLKTFEVWTSDYYLNHGESGEDPDQYYEIEGVDLLQNVAGYNPNGVFIWVPRFQQYAAYDNSHCLMQLFPPETTWNDIKNSPSRYVDAQWSPEKSDLELLRPWADSRCSDIQPKSPR